MVSAMRVGAQELSRSERVRARDTPYAQRAGVQRCGLSDTVVFRPDTQQILNERLAVNDRDPDALFTLAALRTIQGRFEEALEWLGLLEEVEPRYPGVWRLKAKIYELKGDAETAAFYWKMGCDGTR